MGRMSLVTAALSLAGMVVGLCAQTLPPAPRFHFEVASIRPSNANTQSNRLGTSPDGGFRAENVSVTQLIAFAFGVRPFLIVDAPSWASSERFDVIATPDVAEELASDATGPQRDAFRDRWRQRLQALLYDRFGLVVHTENRPMPVYKLVVAKGGHKMAPAASGEERRMQSNPKTLRGTSIDMKALADAISGILVQPVLDETNLPGEFNFNLEFSDVRIEAAAEEASAPTIFTAITEQLGLRLESARAPTSVFVVEKVQRPSEN